MPFYRVDKRALERGMKHELEHTKSRKEARKIAEDHLRQHPTYYDILPLAENIMGLQEKQQKIKPIKRKRRAMGPRMPQGFSDVPPGFTRFGM